MGKINAGRVILGGLVAGVVGDVLHSLLNGVVLSSRLSFAMHRLGLPDFSANQILLANLTGLAWGIATIWLYAAIRPRFGPGPRTAVIAAVATWVIGSLLTMIDLWTAGVWPRGVTVLVPAADPVAAVASSLAGAALYREGEGESRSSAAHA